jgi:hypothetical protein
MGEELDGLTAIDRLRLYAIDPDTFSFDIDDAEDVVAKYDELAARADLVEPLVEALQSIRQYGSDTLSGRVDGPDDRQWQRESVLEMTRRARNALSSWEAAQSSQAQTEARG